MKIQDNSVRVLGVGWADERHCGCVRQAIRKSRAGLDGAPTPARDPWLFAYPVKNFARFDAVSKITCIACALALKDAEIPYAEGVKTDTGLIGTSADGSLEANRAYFQDYVQAGRKLGRANFFIYTLPSSPLAEAAIHFGLQGPVLYAGLPGEGLSALLHLGAELIRGGQAADGLLAVKADPRAAICFALGSAISSGPSTWPLEHMTRLVDAGGAVSELAGRIEADRTRGAGA